jgi:putative endonuclease
MSTPSSIRRSRGTRGVAGPGEAPASGVAAERLAEGYLLAQGIAVIARNFRCRAGELDLVCVDGGYLVVLEVRQRARMDFGGPLASIGAAKRERIRRATEFFRLGAGRWREHPVRFDVVGVVGAIGGAGALGGAAPPFIIWIKDAFRPA